jgi:glycosyltransferase involved in cell wall biosynthesis
MYSRSRGDTGGAELQTHLLAAGLAARGLSVAHIVFPIDDPEPMDASGPTVVQREPWQRGRRLGELAEARAIWRSFDAARARAYIVRGSGGHMSAAAAYCRLRHKSLVFSSSSDLDWDFAREDRNHRTLRIYRASLRYADPVVVQTEQQRALARAALPGREPTLIPSFAEVAEPAKEPPGYFLWADRVVGYKLPERYLDLVAAMPEVRFRMVEATTIESQPDLVDRVRSRAAELPNLELLPRQPRVRLLEEIAGAVAVVSTSRIEGMPNIFLEAWARSVPVLSLNVDPDAKIADNGIGICAEGSMDRFAEGASELWTDRPRRDEMGGRAREFVRRVHSPDAVADRWAALLRELVP